jgi:tol-pal system protein YbgF
MRKIKNYCLLILVATVGAGCLPGTVAQRNDLEEMKRRLAVVEQATVSSQPEQSLSKRLEVQSGKLADLQAEVDGLRVELQRVAGQYEEAAHQREQLHELLTVLRGELELKVAHLEERLVAKKTTVSRNLDPSQVNKQSDAGAKVQYEAALKLIQKQNRFADGRKGLQRFLRDYPKHELTVNAVYWIGEAYYGEKQYEKAILQFLDVIQKYPKHAKASAALLKQGLAFGVLGEKATETALLQQVISDYPKSPAAKKAKSLLKK